MKLKSVFSIAIMMIMVSGTVANGDYIKPANYLDVIGHWGEAKIEKGISLGIIELAENFNPDKSISRYEFAKMMNNAMDLEQKSDKVFVDLEKGSEKEEEILKAVAKGYIVGYEDDTVRPDDNLLRQEAAAMVVSALKLTDNKEAASQYLDFESIDEYAKGKVGAVSEALIMGGTPENKFEPQGTLTRTEALIIAINVAEKTYPDLVIEKDKTVIENQIVKGRLIISEKLGAGSVTLKNVTVGGDTIVKGGGKNSIHLIDSNLSKVVVSDPQNEVRVSFEGNTKVDAVAMESGGQLDSSNFAGQISNVIVSENPNDKSSVIVNVPVTNLDISGNAAMKIAVQAPVTKIEIIMEKVNTASTPTVDVAKGITVNQIVANSQVNVSGSGNIQELQANYSGITLTIKPENIVVAPGVNPPLELKPETKPPTTDSGNEGVKYDQSVSSAIMHIDSGDVVAQSVNGVITFDLRGVNGVLTGITFNSNDKNTYKVTQVSSPNQGNQIGSWSCDTKNKQDMSIFIAFAKSALGFGGSSNPNAMPTAVIRGYGGQGTYSVEGTINGKTLKVEIIL